MRWVELTSRQVGVSFQWLPIYATATGGFSASLPGMMPSQSAVALSDINYERAAILFNIAAMHAALAASEMRTEQEGIKRALAHFQVIPRLVPSDASHLVHSTPLAASRFFLARWLPQSALGPAKRRLARLTSLHPHSKPSRLFHWLKLKSASGKKPFSVSLHPSIVSVALTFHRSAEEWHHCQASRKGR